MALVQQSPIIINLIEPHEKGLSEVLVGSLGLTGAIVVAAIVMGLALAGLLFWFRSRSDDTPTGGPLSPRP